MRERLVEVTVETAEAEIKNLLKLRALNPKDILKVRVNLSKEEIAEWPEIKKRLGAEKDLEIRGHGDILGTRQSGVPVFKIGNIIRDVEILAEARREAEYFLTTLRSSDETAKLLQNLRKDARFRLGGVG